MDLTAVVVDDERPARDELGYLLGRISGVDVVGQAENGVEALTAIDRLQPDVVFLDVQMPGLTGFEVARRMLDSRTASHIIFVTAYDQHAIEAFEVNAVDYLLKPVDQARLDPDVFWRVHRSHLVNINKIKEIVPWFSRNYILRMRDEKSSEIPVSRAQTRRLREYLKL